MTSSHQDNSPFTWRAAAGVAAGVAGVWTAFNAALFANAPAPSHWLGGSFERYPARNSDIAFCVRGNGPPVLLLHGFGAGNSMWEWQNNVAALAENYTVYALDFPGWGLSDKPRIRHDTAEYVELVQNFLHDIVREPCALIASSQACDIAIEVAGQTPESVTRLVLICPAPARENSESAAQIALRSFLKTPAVNTSLYLAITSYKGIESFCQRELFWDKAFVDDALVRRYYANAHQHDAPYGVYSFLEGRFENDTRDSWAALQQPALLVWGRHARLSSLDSAPEWLALKPDARLQVIDLAMMLPHAERAAEWNRAALEFLGA